MRNVRSCTATLMPGEGYENKKSSINQKQSRIIARKAEHLSLRSFHDIIEVNFFVSFDQTIRTIRLDTISRTINDILDRQTSKQVKLREEGNERLGSHSMISIIRDESRSWQYTYQILINQK